MIIDVHAHFMPAAMPACPHPNAQERWPCVRRTGALEAMLDIGPKPFRKVDYRSWDLLRRIDDMDAMSVDVQVLSPMPELLSYWFDYPAARVLCDHINHLIASAVSSAPRRFRGLGMIPMQFPEQAAAMLPDIRRQFGLSGIEIGSNIDGFALGNPRFEPVYAAAEDLELAIFVHALHPLATRNLDLPISGAPMLGFPIDTAMAAVSLMYAGIRERFPRLRMGFSHGGGALGPIVHRLEHGWNVSNGFDGTMNIAPSVQAGGFYYDNLVYSTAYAQHLSTSLAPGNIFVGTDYPYVLMEAQPAQFLAQCRLEPAAAEAVASAAALRFLGEIVT